MPHATVPSESEKNEIYRQMRKLTETILQVRKNYVTDVSCTNLTYGTLNGMLQSLDEHSSYLDPGRLQEMKDDTSGHYGGIGLYIGRKDNRIAVIAPVEDSPGYKAGLLSMDVIMEIDGESTAGMKTEDAVKKLRGKAGTKVVLKIARQDQSAPLTFELTREIINLSTVKGARFERDGIGYIRITQFSEPTAQALQDELDKLAAKQIMRGLILDLRSNPGGLLNSAVAVAEKFLGKDALVVSVRTRSGKAGEKRFLSGGKRHDADTPMAILIDGGSASAAEIVAGALRDHRRAVLVGEKTYGKGSVQTILPLASESNAAIRLTTAYYYTPGERVIHKHGIEPDISAPLSPELRQKIYARRMQLEQPKNYTDEEKKKFADVTDIQLERAADLLQALIALKAPTVQDKPAPVAAEEEPGDEDTGEE